MAAADGRTFEGWLLAIDSSTAEAGVALTNGERFAELNWTADRDQTTTLLDQIDRLLTLMGCGVADLAAVAVATGPGMFSGLRVGMGVAKGLVLGVDVALIGVSTLEATALPFAVTPTPVVATVAAGRGRLVWAVYAMNNSNDLSILTAPRNGTAEDLASAIERFSAGVIICGELTPEQIAVVQTTPGVSIPAEGVRRRRAMAVAELASRRIAHGESDDAVTLEPVYLHARSGA